MYLIQAFNDKNEMLHNLLSRTDSNATRLYKHFLEAGLWVTIMPVGAYCAVDNDIKITRCS